MGGRSSGSAREARRSLRFRRRFLLLTLLVLAFSPSLFALYLLSAKKIHREHLNNKHQTQDKTISGRASLEECASSATESRKVCCALWTTNTDGWWTQHPGWEVGPENATHTCFTRMTAGSAQLEFVQKLHQLQWQSDCSTAVQAPQISSGYAAALMAVARSFYAAYRSHQPFQITRAHHKANWNFSPRRHHNKTTHWASCPTEDMNCYYLNISSCPAVLGQHNAARGTKPSSTAAKDEFRWLRQYAFRPRHVVRLQLQRYFLEQQNVAVVTRPCAAIHVRRGDIAFGRGRRYAAVDEYLEAGHIQKGETVLLLTDDVSATEEVEQYHKDDYNWVYLDRPRFRGSSGGFEGFIPSQDPAMEILAIMAELKLASQCNKLVHGKSGFVAVIVEAMENAGHPFETFYLQTQQNKQEQAKMDPKDRAQVYLQQIQERLERKKNPTDQSVSAVAA